MKFSLMLVAAACCWECTQAFAPLMPRRAIAHRAEVALAAGGGSRKKRRRRKQATGTSTAGPEAVPGVKKEKKEVASVGPTVDKEEERDVPTKEDLSMLSDVASFKFESDDSITIGIQDDESAEPPEKDDVLVLPDIKDQIRKKQMEQELAIMEEGKKNNVKKIKRSDVKAFTKLLESQPFADADDSFFEEEEYGTISALLGERTKPFLGIPSGFLQVGHFIGALGIVLMAFVQYPGFPLTNLPTPLRESFQGGLATIYAINTVLAVVAVFKAGERGQSKALWAVKTFSVGGLALDQLTQLPTVEQVEQAKSRKGKRAPNKKR